MSIPASLPAINTLLKAGDAATPTEGFNTIANIGDYNEILSMTTDTVDVTSHSTGVPWSEIVPTLLNGGKVTFPIFFIPSSGGPDGDGVIGHNNTAGFMKLFTKRGAGGVAGVPINFKIVFPDTDVTTYTFKGFVTAFKIKAPVKGVLTADIEISVTLNPNLTL